MINWRSQNLQFDCVRLQLQILLGSYYNHGQVEQLGIYQEVNIYHGQMTITSRLDKFLYFSI